MSAPKADALPLGDAPSQTALIIHIISKNHNKRKGQLKISREKPDSCLTETGINKYLGQSIRFFYD
jgi:hypothetical protein